MKMTLLRMTFTRLGIELIVPWIQDIEIYIIELDNILLRQNLKCTCYDHSEMKMHIYFTNTKMGA